MQCLAQEVSHLKGFQVARVNVEASDGTNLIVGQLPDELSGISDINIKTAVGNSKWLVPGVSSI